MAHAGGIFFFMDTKQYEKSPDFDRNRAIFVLFSVDGVSIQQIALNFNLDSAQIKNIITVHEKYESLMRD